MTRPPCVMSNNLPRYPVYIPSKNRHDVCYTAAFFLRDGVDFRLVVEPSQSEKYISAFGKEQVLVLPEDGLKLLGSRLWIRQHSIDNGFDRHWQFDDNIRYVGRLNGGKRIICNANVAISALEDFTDRYENIGISGFNYRMFVHPTIQQAFFTNCHVYSASLVNNQMPYKWRLYYNDDTDLCLQVVTNNLCTVLFNAFFVDKMKTMTVKGGNTQDLYQKDGRLIMARTLEEVWPKYVTTKWRYGRPQHVVKDSWKCFKTPLRLKRDIDLSAMPKVDERGIQLKQLRDIKSDSLRAWAEGQISKTTSLD